MNISEQDKIETIKISEIINKIDKIDNDYFNKITDEMNQYQPFLSSMLLGYQFDKELSWSEWKVSLNVLRKLEIKTDTPKYHKL